MAKWSYLRRAYAIQEYAYMRATEADTEPEHRWRTETEADDISAVVEDVKQILDMAEDNFISRRETPYEYRTINQCEKFLTDFAKGG